MVHQLFGCFWLLCLLFYTDWLRTSSFTLKMKLGASSLSSSPLVNKNALDTYVKQPMRINRAQPLKLLPPKIKKIVCGWWNYEDAGEDPVHLGTGTRASAVWGI